MKKTYKHLSLGEREEISLFFSQGVSLGNIAKKIDRNKGTISREIHRNSPPINKGYYRGHKAQERADIRNIETHSRPRIKDSKTRNHVIKKLKEGWSPELISGRINSELPGESIGYESIYQYIYNELILP